LPSTCLWLVDGRSVRDQDLACFAPQLSMDEARRFARFVRPQRRRQFLLGRMLLRHAVSGLTRLPPAAISTSDRPGQAPQLILPDGSPPPFFSLSHSRDWIACAVSHDTVLGLDIEMIDPGRDIIGLSQSAFRAEESAWVAGQREDTRVSAFYRLWSLKEALFKLRSNLGNAEELPSLLGEDGALALHGSDWFSSALPHPDLSIAICATQPLSAIPFFNAGFLKEIDRKVCSRE
jgi:4'-phosphopantetheinyl transferase